MRNNWKRAIGAWGPAVVYMAVIFTLSAQSKLPAAPGILGWDKLQHLIAYAVMGLLLFRAAILRPLTRLGPYLMTLIIGALHGAADEYHQSFVPGRNMSAHDWAADVLGLVLALAILRMATHRTNQGG